MKVPHLRFGLLLFGGSVVIAISGIIAWHQSASIRRDIEVSNRQSRLADNDYETNNDSPMESNLVRASTDLSESTLEEGPTIHAKSLDQVVGIFDLIEPTPDNITKNFGKEDLPTLYELVLTKDEALKEIRYKAIMAVGFLGPSPESAKVLRSFIVEHEAYKDLHSVAYRADKAHALEYLGLIGGEIAVKTLHQALTREGSLELGKKWIGQKFPMADQTDDFTINMRQRAAVGLVYTQDPENLALVEEAYREALEAARPIAQRYGGSDKVHPGSGAQDWEPIRLYSEMAWVMAVRDAIEEVGLENYLPAVYDAGKRMALIRHHWKEYLVLESP